MNYLTQGLKNLAIADLIKNFFYIRKGAEMQMLEEIKNSIKAEVRANSMPGEYLEAVILIDDIDKLKAILNKYLGAAKQEAGKSGKFPKNVQDLINNLGGLRRDQSFYYKEENDGLSFAALWPWQSDPSRITLKAGFEK